MKQKLKKVFENAVWWSGVITVGIVLGVSLQIVKAWTEPTEAPPGGNVGAPINTSPIGQFKHGVLQLLGLTLYNDPAVSGVDVTGKVLTAQNAYGATAWAAGGGGGGIYTNWGFNTCVGSDTKIYDGEAIFPADGNGKGGVICLNGHLKDWPSSSTTGTYWQNGKENAPAGSGSYDWVIVRCAVCTK